MVLLTALHYVPWHLGFQESCTVCHETAIGVITKRGVATYEKGKYIKSLPNSLIKSTL